MTEQMTGFVISQRGEARLNNLVTCLRAVARPIAEAEHNDDAIPISGIEASALLDMAADAIEIELANAGFTVEPAPVKFERLG